VNLIILIHRDESKHNTDLCQRSTTYWRCDYTDKVNTFIS